MQQVEVLSQELLIPLILARLVLWRGGNKTEVEHLCAMPSVPWYVTSGSHPLGPLHLHFFYSYEHITNLFCFIHNICSFLLLSALQLDLFTSTGKNIGNNLYLYNVGNDDISSSHVLSRARNSWTHWRCGEILEGCLNWILLVFTSMPYSLKFSNNTWQECYRAVNGKLFPDEVGLKYVDMTFNTLMTTPITVTLWWINVISLSLLSECYACCIEEMMLSQVWL